jgi:transcriptional regulator with XRE-family HTH domain
MPKSRESKKNRPPPMIRQILARNVIALRDRKFSHARSETGRNKLLARASGTTLSQIQRICEAKLGTGIDMLEWLAQAFETTPANLVTPYFATQETAAPETELHGDSGPGPVPLQRKSS